MRAVWRVDSVVISDIMWNATLWLHSIIKTFLWLLFELSALDHLIKGWRCLNCCLCTNPKENMQVKEKLQFITTYSSKYWPWSQDYGGISECDDVHVVRKVKKLFLTLSLLSLLAATCVCNWARHYECLLVNTEWICVLFTSFIPSSLGAVPLSGLVRGINTLHYIQTGLFQKYSLYALSNVKFSGAFGFTSK